MNKKHPYARPEAGFSSNHGDNQDNDGLSLSLVFVSSGEIYFNLKIKAYIL